MFSMAVAEKITVSCGTMPIRCLTSASRAFAISVPSRKTLPDAGS